MCIISTRQHKGKQFLACVIGRISNVCKYAPGVVMDDVMTVLCGHMAISGMCVNKVAFC